MTFENKTNAQLREILPQRVWDIYKLGLHSIASDASRAVRGLRRKLAKLRHSIDDFCGLYDTPEVPNEQVRQAYIAIRRALAEVEWDLIEHGTFGFVSIENPSMSPICFLLEEHERLSGLLTEVERGTGELAAEAAVAAKCA